MLGAGFFAPFCGSSHWGKNDEFAGSTKYPLAAGGVQRWFAIDGHVRVLYFTAGAAYRLGPLSIGATGNFISSTIDSTKAKNPGGANLAITSMEGRAFLDAHTFNGSFAAGADARAGAGPTLDWRVVPGPARPRAAERSKGTFNVTSPMQRARHAISHVDFYQTLPDIYRAGVRWQAQERSHSNFESSVIAPTGASSSRSASCLSGHPCNVNADGSDNAAQPRDPGLSFVATGATRTAVAWASAGGSSPPVELLFGGGYETAATPDSTLAPDLFDANNFQATLGARFRLTESLFLTASYTQIQYMTRDNDGKEHPGRRRAAACGAVSRPSRRTRAASTSRGSAS